MRNYTDEQLRSMTFEQAEAELSNAIYEAALLVELLEHSGRVSGNGHHARQKIAAAAVEELRSRWIVGQPTS